ncbi:MAG: SGNH/GDSL hydrolase family protein [Clostridiales bacterium]|jgi:acyl-CoA thioesterase-1|nr:SGNH/GDSL hydrolase family protein [Clostridiales bacterium]
MFKKNSVVLFQGDSITDANRNYEDENSWGFGYVNMIASRLSAVYPELNIRYINKGICGHRVIDLKERWKRDCIDLSPDYLSIMIGINDTLRRYDSNLITSAEEFKANYRDILLDVKNNTNAKIIICEPFIIPVSEEKKMWREDLEPKINAVRELAIEFADVFIPLDGIFAAACCKREPTFWSLDGIHPIQNGSALITEEWINAVKSL